MSNGLRAGRRKHPALLSFSEHVQVRRCRASASTCPLRCQSRVMTCRIAFESVNLTRVPLEKMISNGVFMDATG